LVERREIFDDWTRIRNEWILIKDGQTRTFKFNNTVYSAQELKDRIPVRQVKVYGDLDGNEYGPAALRLIAAARK
jgi:hypothetical protein